MTVSIGEAVAQVRADLLVTHDAAAVTAAKDLLDKLDAVAQEAADARRDISSARAFIGRLEANPARTLAQAARSADVSATSTGRSSKKGESMSGADFSGGGEATVADLRRARRDR